MSNSTNKINNTNDNNIDNKITEKRSAAAAEKKNTKPTAVRYGLPVGSREVLGPDNRIVRSAESPAKKTKTVASCNIIHNSTEKPVENKPQSIKSVETKSLSAIDTVKEEKKELALSSDNSKVSVRSMLGLLKSEKTKTVSVSDDKNAKKPFPVFAFLTILSVCILLMFVIIDYVQIFENESMVNELKNELESMKQEESRLSEQLEQKNDIISISKYASEKLGMVGSENQKSVYIDLSENDSIQGYEPSNTDYGAIATVMDALGESAKAWIGIFGK